MTLYAGVPLEPGARKTYVYDLTEDGRPERASFQWYHDHRLDRTAPHVWKGMAGMWIVDDEFAQAPGIVRFGADRVGLNLVQLQDEYLAVHDHELIRKYVGRHLQCDVSKRAASNFAHSDAVAGEDMFIINIQALNAKVVEWLFGA